MTKKATNIPQGTLYTIARTAWGFATEALPSFAAFSGRYTPAAIAAALAAIHTAEQLPDYQARTTATQVHRIQLHQLMRHATATWQLLKRYIATAYPTDQLHIHYAAAGEQHYRAAAQQSWTHLASLMQAGKQFLDTHQAQLLAHNSMPLSFIATYHAVAAQVLAKQGQLVHSRQQSPRDTAAKTAANNQVATTLSILLADAKIIFKSDPILRQRFTLSHLRALLHPTHQPHSSTTAPILGTTTE